MLNHSLPIFYENIFYENILFFVSVTAFFFIVGWAWRHSKLYELPKPLPGWFKIWFLSVQLGGIVIPIVALFWWGVWRGHAIVLTILLSYFLMLGLQILSESVALRWFRSTVFVMVPYLYIPYRVWQLFIGLLLLNSNPELIVVKNILLGEIALWSLNYALDLSQLPRLFRWESSDRAVEATDSTP